MDLTAHNVTLKKVRSELAPAVTNLPENQSSLQPPPPRSPTQPWTLQLRGIFHDRVICFLQMEHLPRWVWDLQMKASISFYIMIHSKRLIRTSEIGPFFVPFRACASSGFNWNLEMKASATVSFICILWLKRFKIIKSVSKLSFKHCQKDGITLPSDNYRSSKVLIGGVGGRGSWRRGQVVRGVDL